MLPIEIASFNTQSLAEHFVDLWDTNPKTIQLPYIDANGKKQIKTLQNRGAFQQDIWNYLQSNMPQMQPVTFYVDQTNGDDNNTGTSSAPFRTLKKAIDSVAIGGYGAVYINGDYNFIDGDVYLKNKTIFIYIKGNFKVNFIQAPFNANAYILESRFRIVNSNLQIYKDSHYGNSSIVLGANIADVDTTKTFYGNWCSLVIGDQLPTSVKFLLRQRETDYNPLLIAEQYTHLFTGNNYSNVYLDLAYNNKALQTKTDYLISAPTLSLYVTTLNFISDENGNTLTDSNRIVANVLKDPNGAYKNIITNLNL